MGDLTVSEVLSKAADILARPRAWGRGLYGFHPSKSGVLDKGCYCIIGALAKATDRSAASVEGDADLIAPLAAAVGVSTSNAIIRWNDDPLRRKREVVAALREASKRASTPPNEPSAAMGKGGGG